eukprot:6456818-Amphidinium_carterae.1
MKTQSNLQEKFVPCVICLYFVRGFDKLLGQKLQTNIWWKVVFEWLVCLFTRSPSMGIRHLNVNASGEMNTEGSSPRA